MRTAFFVSENVFGEKWNLLSELVGCFNFFSKKDGNKPCLEHKDENYSSKETRKAASDEETARTNKTLQGLYLKNL